MLGLNNINNIPSINANILNSLANKPPLGLTQIKDVNMPVEFTDDAGAKWHIAKSYKDSSVEIPDPSLVSITRWWNHAHPASDGKVFIYVVEGIKRPRIDTEQPVMVLYQWFSTTNRPNFTPADITPAEWYNANVYTAGIIDSRVSQLNALCGCNINQPTTGNSAVIPELDSSLIGVKNDRTAEKETGRSDKAYKR